MKLTRAHYLAIAGRLGVIGGGLGIVAGVVQATVGNRIPDWSGDKHQPVALGLLTVVLSASALAAARTLRVADAPHDSVIARVAIWLAIVAAVCSTTVGRLWAVPGLLVVVSAGATVAAIGWQHFRAEVAAHWLRGLLGILGGFALLMAVSAAPAATIAAGALAGASLIAAASLATPGRRWIVCGLVAATLPFAILAWWAVVPPLLTAAALVISIAVTSGGTERAGILPAA